ncbi:MAG: tetratricopeptide repeat protein [Thermodesulfovibrionales bacterium]
MIRLGRTACRALSAGMIVSVLAGCALRETVAGWLGQASVQQNRKAGEKEVGQFMSGVRSARGNPGSHYTLALYYQQRGMHRDALVEFRKTLMVDPSSARAYNGLGASLDMLGEFDEARAAYERALALEPGNAYVLNNLGYSLLLQGKPEEAVVPLRKAVERDGASATARYNLGMAYALSGNPEQALTEFAEAGDPAKAPETLAGILYRKGLFAAAREQYESALAYGPLSAATRAGLEASAALVAIAGGTELRERDDPKDAAGAAAVRTSEERPLHQEEATPSVPPLQEARGVPKSGIPADARIEIANGNGVNNMAKLTKQYLMQQGIPVARLTNDESFRHARTTVYYRAGYDKAAAGVAGALPVSPQTEMRSRLGLSAIKVKVVIGRDLIPRLADRGKEGGRS